MEFRFSLTGLASRIILGKRGPGLAAASGRIEARKPDNTALTQVQVADPLYPDDAVTKRYADSRISSLIPSPAGHRLIRTDVSGALTESSLEADPDGSLLVPGDLTVKGRSAVLDTTTLASTAKVFLLVRNAALAADADGAGLVLGGVLNRFIRWSLARGAWFFSDHIDLAPGMEIRADGTEYLQSKNSDALPEGTVHLYYTDQRAREANTDHRSDATIHITSQERTAWNGVVSDLGSETVNRLQGDSNLQSQVLSSTCKPQARVATTANVVLNGMAVIDSVSVAEGDLILVKDQTDASTNGLYIVSTGPWLRHPSAIDLPRLRNCIVPVGPEGRINRSTLWQAAVPAAAVEGAAPISFLPMTTRGLALAPSWRVRPNQQTGDGWPTMLSALRALTERTHLETFIPTIRTPAADFPEGTGGACLMADGRFLLPPEDLPVAAIFDPDDLSVTPSAATFPGRTAGACLLPDTRLFLPPALSDTAAFYDAAQDRVTVLPRSFPTTTRGALLMADQRIFLPPALTAQAAIYDFATDTLQLPGAYFPATTFGALLLPDRRIFLPPRLNALAAIYNPEDNSLALRGGFPATTSGACFMMDGRIFLPPCNSTTGAIFDVDSDEITVLAGIFPPSTIGACPMMDSRLFLPPGAGNTASMFDQKDLSVSTVSGFDIGPSGAWPMMDGGIFLPPRGASTARVFRYLRRQAIDYNIATSPYWSFFLPDDVPTTIGP